MESEDSLKHRLSVAIDNDLDGREQMMMEILHIHSQPSKQVILVRSNGEILIGDPSRTECYHCYPDGPLFEYETREYVDDINVGEPIPDEYTEPDWTPIDPDWRASVRNATPA